MSTGASGVYCILFLCLIGPNIMQAMQQMVQQRAAGGAVRPVAAPTSRPSTRLAAATMDKQSTAGGAQKMPHGRIYNFSAGPAQLPLPVSARAFASSVCVRACAHTRASGPVCLRAWVRDTVCAREPTGAVSGSAEVRRPL